MIWDALNSLMAWLCQTIYPLIAYAYKLFYNIGTLRIISDEKIEPIYNRVTLILGLVMLFVVTFQLIQYVMEPDNFTDKEKGFGKVMYRMILSVILIAFVPNIFNFAFELQKDIMDNNIIQNLILGTKDNYSEDWGGKFSASVLHEFYRLNPNISDHTCTDSNGLSAENVVNLNLNTLSTKGNLNTLSFCINDKSSENDAENVIKFDGIIAVLTGGLILWMLVMYCLDLGTRVIQLTYLQVIAPIPIIMYMLPKKDGAFEKWTKQCITTFLDLFLRTAIICFTVLIISTITNSFGDITENISASSQGDAMFTSLLKVCLILGVMTFAKKAGDMLKELFPKENAASGELGISPKRMPEPAKRVFGAAKGFVAGGAVGLATRAARNINFARRGKDEKQNLKTRLANSRAEYSAAMRTVNDTTKTQAERNEARKQAQAYKKEMSSINTELKKYNTGRLIGGTVAGGLLGGANRGALAGLTSKEGKGAAAKARKEVMQYNQAYDEWRENGGISSVNRVISGLSQSIGINPTEVYDKKKERIEKENNTLGKVSDYFGKAKEAVEKDIEDGKCDGFNKNARDYRLKQVEAERLTAQAGNLKLTDFAYKDATERQSTKSQIENMLKTPQKKLTSEEYSKLDTHGRIEYRKNAMLLEIAEQYYATDPKKVNGKKLQELTGKDKENAISRMLDKLADSACEVNYEATVKEFETQAIDAKNDAVELKKKAIKEVGDTVMNGGIKDQNGEVIYSNAKAEQLITMMKDAVDIGSADVDILYGRDLATFAKLDDLSKEAATRQNTNASELYRMEQSPEYKAAQADKKYNESGKK